MSMPDSKLEGEALSDKELEVKDIGGSSFWYSGCVVFKGNGVIGRFQSEK